MSYSIYQKSRSKEQFTIMRIIAVLTRLLLIYVAWIAWGT